MLDVRKHNGDQNDSHAPRPPRTAYPPRDLCCLPWVKVLTLVPLCTRETLELLVQSDSVLTFVPKLHKHEHTHRAARFLRIRCIEESRGQFNGYGRRALPQPLLSGSTLVLRVRNDAFNQMAIASPQVRMKIMAPTKRPAERRKFCVASRDERREEQKGGVSDEKQTVAAAAARFVTSRRNDGDGDGGARGEKKRKRARRSASIRAAGRQGRGRRHGRALTMELSLLGPVNSFS